MKNKCSVWSRLLLLVVIALPLFFSACSEDEPDGPEEGAIWDFVPFSIDFCVQNHNGVDLLNPASPNSVADNHIKAIYGGKIFEKDSLLYPTKAIPARFYGLQTVQYGNRYFLSFGEFASDRNYTDHDIVIDWNDGTPNDTITFTHRFWWEKHDPKMETTLYVNGKKRSSPIVFYK